MDHLAKQRQIEAGAKTMITDLKGTWDEHLAAIEERMQEDRGRHESEQQALQELLADVQEELVALQRDLQEMHTAAASVDDASEEAIVAKALQHRSGRLFRLATMHACGSLPAAWHELASLSTEAGRVNR